MTSLDIKQLAAEHFGVTLAALDGRAKPPHIEFARQCAMTACAIHLPYTYSAIADDFGRRSKSTIYKATGRTEKLRKTPSKQRDLYEAFIVKVVVLKSVLTRPPVPLARFSSLKGVLPASNRSEASQSV